MSAAISYIQILVVVFEIISAVILTYAIATSKADSKKIIKAVLIGTGIYIIASLIPVVGIIIPFIVFPVVFCILGSHTGHKFNAGGLISLIAYLVSLFVLPVVSNKNEDSLVYQLTEGIIDELGVKLTPTQFEILSGYSKLSEYSDTIAGYFSTMYVMLIGILLFAILLFDMTLLRKNTAQMLMGSILSFFTAGMLYLDYCIFHSDSLGGKLVGMALAKMGFSLSPLCILIMLFAILTIITAYRCKIKEK